jgi:hypothetical protein
MLSRLNVRLSAPRARRVKVRSFGHTEAAGGTGFFGPRVELFLRGRHWSPWLPDTFATNE